MARRESDGGKVDFDQSIKRASSRASDGTAFGNSGGPGVDSLDAASLLSAQRPRPHKLWRKKYVKFLVVGDSGLGKTTLIRSLMSVPGQNLDIHDGTETSPEQFRSDPDSLCSTVSWEDSTDKVVWVYKVQDTPGYGDDLNIMNNIQQMVAYVEAQNRAWLRVEMDKKREVDLSELEDPRVDLCLFCLQPHRLRPVDLRFMLELGRVVPILPIVTKADTMTIREASTYRQEVHAKFQNCYIPGVRALGGVAGSINVFAFDEGTRQRAQLEGGAHPSPMPPFFVIASNETNRDLASQDPPVYWPERIYPWGVSQAFNPEHSDLMHLRKLLMAEACEEISAAKRVRYQRWRKRQLARRAYGRQLFSALLVLVLPAAFVAVAALANVPLEEVTDAMADRVRAQLRRLRPPFRLVTVAEAAPEEEDFIEEDELPPLPRKKFLGIF